MSRCYYGGYSIILDLTGRNTGSSIVDAVVSELFNSPEEIEEGRARVNAILVNHLTIYPLEEELEEKPDVVVLLTSGELFHII